MVLLLKNFFLYGYPTILILSAILFNNSVGLNDKLWEHNCSSGGLTAIELCPKQSAHFHKKTCHFTSKNKCLTQN